MYKLFTPWLLLSYVAFCLYRTPEISDSVIVVAIATLTGFELFFKSKMDFFLKTIEKNKDNELDELNRELQKASLNNRINDEKSRSNYKSLSAINKKVQF